ncbi:MAG TPA: glycosyltransferase family 4 protein [Bacilli bacterium]
MKLLFAYFVPSGGMETLNRTRCRELQKRGIICHLLYAKSGAGLQNNLTAIPTHITDNDHAIKHLLQTERFDAVIVNANFPMMERIRQFGFAGPVIFEVQGLGQQAQAVQTMTQASPYIRSFCNAALYPPTSHLKQLFQSFYPNLKKYCFPNIFDSDQFTYRQHTINPSPILGWVGRIEANKNWKSFLEIGYWMIRSNPAIRLWLFEDANIYIQEERVVFEQMLQVLNLNPKLTLFSNVPHGQMADYLSKIGDSGGFLCSTSILEGFGYAVAEAMSCRCPVLSTDSDGVRSFIVHDKTGKFYPHGDIHKAVNQGLELMNHAALRNTIRDDAQRHIRSSFSPEQYCRNFMNMMHELGV